jgi:NAD(P)-dependent dehydrogenase (short-subunit alcohol dehydrogenase family)
VDIAINTVGRVLKKPFVETTEEDYDSMAAINSKAAYFFMQEAGKQLKDGGKVCTVVGSLLAAYTGRARRRTIHLSKFGASHRCAIPITSAEIK